MYVVKEILEGEETFDKSFQVVLIGDEKECDEYIASHPDEIYEDQWEYEETKYKKYESVPGLLWTDTREIYPSTGKFVVEVDINGSIVGGLYSYDSRYTSNDVMNQIKSLLAK